MTNATWSSASSPTWNYAVSTNGFTQNWPQNGLSPTNTWVGNNLSSGKYRFSFQIITTYGAYLGVADTTVLDSPSAFIANFAGINTLNGDMWVNNTNEGVLGTLSGNDWLDICFDAGAKLIWMRLNDGNWNNNSSADPDTGTDGFSCSSITNFNPFWNNYGGYVYSTIFLNSGQQAYTYTMPTTFSNLPQTLTVTSVNTNLTNDEPITANWTDNDITGGINYSYNQNTFESATVTGSGASGTATSPSIANVNTLYLQDANNPYDISLPFVFDGTPPYNGGEILLQVADILQSVNPPSGNLGPDAFNFTPATAITFTCNFVATMLIYNVFFYIQNSAGQTLITFSVSNYFAEGYNEEALSVGIGTTVIVDSNTATISGTAYLNPTEGGQILALSCNGTGYRGNDGTPGIDPIAYSRLYVEPIWYPGGHEQFNYSIVISVPPTIVGGDDSNIIFVT